MQSSQYKLDIDILDAEMDKRDLNGKRLASLVGVSEATITKWRRGEGISGANLARLANALNVAMPFLLGATSNPLPEDLGNDSLMVELIQIVQKLSPRRRRDLIAIANTYWETSEQLRENKSLLAEELLALAQEAGGASRYQQLVEYLRSDEWKSDTWELEGQEPGNPSGDK